MTKKDIIDYYGMEPLDVEGGMWKAMFRSDEVLPERLFPGRKGAHSLYGSILYLLTKDSVSRMHRLPTDEIWHFYMGSPCELLVLKPDGSSYTERLGQDILRGEKVTALAPRGCWQGCRIADGYDEDAWALLGTTMSPAYEDSDYEDGTPSLLDQYPEMESKIRPLLARPGEATLVKK